MFLKIGLKKPTGIRFLSSEQGEVYLVDKTDKARLIPDVATYNYLVDVLNEVNPVIQVSSNQIAMIKGAPLTSVQYGYQYIPSTPADELKNFLDDKITADLEFHLEDTPPNITVKVESHDPVVRIKKAKLNPKNLSENDLSHVHRKESIYRIIPGIKDANLTPENPILIPIHLRQDISPEVVQRHINTLFTLYLEVQHGEQTTELRYHL
jgi:hypothetical protein